MLSNFKTAFSNTYQEIFQKVLVGKEIANTRFQADLKYGQSVTRVKYDISNVRVRAITIGSDRTVDSISDSTQLLTINKNYGTTFPMSTKEVVQAGPLNPASVIGGKVAKKTAIFVDADILAETLNAAYTFDNGDLTTGASDGTSFALTSTTVPQFVTRAPAKLRRNHQDLSNIALVVDSYGASDLAQYILGKNIDLAGSVFKNGYSGSIANAEVYTSENLTGEALLTLSGTPSDGDTFTIGGVVFTFKTALAAGAGQVLIGGSAAASATNLAALINAPGTTTANGVALSAADQITVTDSLRLVASNPSTTTIKLVGTGSGRMTISKSGANLAVTKNFIHAYFGRKGAIDVVIQDQVDMEMRDEPKQRSMNIMSDVLYGIKTFTDGAAQFLDVWLTA